MSKFCNEKPTIHHCLNQWKTKFSHYISNDFLFSRALRYSSTPSTSSRNCQLSGAVISQLGSSMGFAKDWVVYERLSYAGVCRGGRFGLNAAGGGGDRTEADADATTNLLARYDRYKVDYRVISTAILQRKSVPNAQQCARACDAHRSILDCQAFAFT